MRLSVVVPVLDEEDNVEPLTHAVAEAMVGLTSDYELIFVDDGSLDSTALRVKRLHGEDQRVKLLSLSRRFGHQTALTAGMDVATGDAVVLMDGDLQHPPALLRDLVARWREGYDVVYTIRNETKGVGFLKRATSSLFYRLFRKATGMDVPFHAADFRLLDRRVVNALGAIRERTRFLRGLTAWVGYRATGVPYTASARHAGRTKYGIFEMTHLALDGIVSFTSIPLYAAVYTGALLSAVAFLYSVYVVYIRLFTSRAVAGWASVIMLLAAVGGIQLLVLGVLGIYIGKIYEEVKQRPLYLVRDALGLPGTAPYAAPSVPGAARPPGAPARGAGFDSGRRDS